MYQQIWKLKNEIKIDTSFSLFLSFLASGAHEFKKPFHKKVQKTQFSRSYESLKKFLLDFLGMINVFRHNKLMEEEKQTKDTTKCSCHETLCN